jgi:ATPase
MKIEKLVPDTSVIIEGLISERIANKKLKPEVIIIHEAVLAELENQANKNKSIGHLGLEEIKKLKAMEKKYNFEIKYSGRRPNAAEIKHASLGEIDALIRQLASEDSATLFTADKIQAQIAQLKGIPVIFEQIEVKQRPLLIEKFFDAQTMSIHLRENVEPFAKKGIPGKWDFIKLRDKVLSREEIEEISEQLIEEANLRKDGFIEIERPSSTILQIERYRIVITRPPLSDGWEITAVRPVRIMTLEEYKLSEKLLARISEQAEGILIAGAPGMGKSTFAQALATFYADKGKIVKTIEAPRDLLLKDNITQYAISRGTPQEIHDILLLSRPDYTVFDEMRNTGDFKLFADMRLAGIGLAGVVHATNPIDAIQRFVGRIELGVIPQVIDTVIFIKNGIVFKLLSLEMTVKVPSGMVEADLARPVVVVNDFETGKLEFELYSYGEETVVIPVSKGKTGQTPASALASKSIKQAIEQYTNHVEVEMESEHKAIVYVPQSIMPKLIGKQGKNINNLEKELVISIDVRDISERKSERSGKPERSEIKSNDSKLEKHKQLHYDIVENKKKLIFSTGGKNANKDIDMYLGDDFLLTAKIGKDGKLKINRNSEVGEMILEAMDDKMDVLLIEK